MGEHLPCKQGVRGSNPLISTGYRKIAKRLTGTRKCVLTSGAGCVYLENFIQRDKL